MKTKFILLALACLSHTLLFAQKNIAIDAKASTLTWTGHAEIGSYAPQGTLNFSSGTVSFKGETVVGADLAIDMKTMQQSNNDLVTHLKSADFFDVETYPVAAIKITRIAGGQAYGKLTIKNKTQPFSCPVAIVTANKQYTITGKTVIDRTKYGIIYNSGSFFSNLGDHAIRNTFEVEFKVVAGM